MRNDKSAVLTTAPARTDQRTAQMEAVATKVGKAFSVEAVAPPEVAQKAEATGVTKGARDTLSTITLGLLAGVFIGLGAMFYTVVTTNSGLGFGMARLVGGLAFCLGLVLVVVAGAELFTGNTLIVMSWLSGRVKLSSLLRNWTLVYFANMAGAISLAFLMFYTNQWSLSNDAVGANALAIANGKVNLAFGTALARGIMCNALVCLAVWLCFSARTVTDKIIAILFPITAFVAAGFEHSVANMYFIPLGILLSGQQPVLTAAGVTAAGVSHLTWTGFIGNLIPVTIGNIIGGGILVGAVYWITYLGRDRATEAVSVRPWLQTIFPGLARKTPAPAAVDTARLNDAVRDQIETLIRTKLEEPQALDNGSKALLAVLSKARDDNGFLSKLADDPAHALEGWGLTLQERAAISSGDIRWIESKLGRLDEPLRTWFTARLSQEKW